MKSNTQSRKFLYRIALMGTLVSIIFGMGGPATVHAQQAVAAPQRIYLPVVIREFPIPTHRTLTVTKIGAGSGTVISSPAGIDCGLTCSASFPSNTLITLTAAAGANSIFFGWGGSGCSNIGTCVLTMDAAKSVTATFTSTLHELRIGKSGTGSGTVTSSPTGIECGLTCIYNFPYNTNVILTATPSSSSIFSGWSGVDCPGTGICQINMNTDQQILATFISSCSGLLNCDFESGPNGQWTEYSTQGFDIIYDCSDPTTCNDITPHSGIYLAWLGGVDAAPPALTEISSIQQQISITSNAPFLTYWQWIESEDYCGSDYGKDYDFAEVLINTTRVDKYDLCAATNTGGWVSHNIDLTGYAGRSVSLLMRVTTDDSNNSNLYIDDISLEANPLTVGTLPGSMLAQMSNPIRGKTRIGRER